MKTKNNNANECALKLKNIEKYYGVADTKVKALKGVSLDFRKNEFVSILGPSGCGKTTLLNIIGGLDRYTSGDLIIDGVSTKKYKDSDWDTYRNNSIGFVFQSYNLISHQTILSNVELALTLSGISKKERRQRALKALEEVGLKGQEHKKPNQLSGGQMQRVAIARALINNPKIILADEPTGALDTDTSIQVMNLLKKVALDRLVIMVTHNPSLAETYSTRIIKLLDGLVVDDSNPLKAEEVEAVRPKKVHGSAMSFFTALMLSLSNLRTKRGRTILTSIAGSIGIIGIALVLAISNGLSSYMARIQTDTLATYPLTISESSVDLSTFMEVYENETKEKFPELDNVFVAESFRKLTGMLKQNNLSDTSEDGFVSYLDKMDSSLYYAIQKEYGFDMNDYIYTNITLNDISMFTSIDSVVNIIENSFEQQLQSAMGLSTSFVRQYIPTVNEMPDYDLVLEQYDVLYGELPKFTSENANKIVLVVNEYNTVSDITLMLLGYISGGYDVETNGFSFEQAKDGNGQIKEIALEDILGKKFYLAKNDIMFSKGEEVFYPNIITEDNEELTPLEIAGILRVKENTDGILKTGLNYSPKLTQKVIDENKNSEIATVINENGSAIIKSLNPKVKDETVLPRSVACVDTPSNISVFAKDFDSKEKVKSYIDEWNKGKTEDDKNYIVYSDMMSMMFGMLGTLIDAVTYVLIAFTSISLVVSSIMIGIITYVSVVERTKEIGILRAIGARKKDISRIFNAETFIIGLFAGLIGVGATYLLSIPINLIVGGLVQGIGNVASLKISDAIILVIVSFILTLIAGIVPARIASKKDPVVALRSE